MSHAPHPAASHPHTQIIRAGPADCETLSHLIADAFADLPPSRWLISDPQARRAIFPAYFAIITGDALAHGIVYTTLSRAAAALWLPAGDKPAPPPAEYEARLAAVTGPWLHRFTAFDTALGARHPAGPHHHLAILAVAPDQQGRGIGSALLAHHHALLDDTGIPAYLEAASPFTRGIYLRRGYADHGNPIRLPGGPPMYPMIREPQPRQ